MLVTKGGAMVQTAASVVGMGQEKTREKGSLNKNSWFQYKLVLSGFREIQALMKPQIKYLSFCAFLKEAKISNVFSSHAPGPTTYHKTKDISHLAG